MLLTKKKTKYNFYGKPFTIIIPCYNEKPTYIRKCVDSILTSEGKKQIILVDNNSDSLDSIGIINEYKKDSRVLVLNEEKQGKRFAQIKGLKYAENDLIIFVDSDTIVSRTSLVELIKPFQDNNIGATTGQVLLANKNYNFLTRCLNAMYWTSSNIFRRASASLGFMQVCCGALSCYRKEDLLSIKNLYLNQKFLGRPCGISDDRFLTMRIQSRCNKQVEYVEKAFAYTFSPHTIFGFWKQFVRWRRGMIREVFLLWKEPKKNIKLLFFDTQFNFVVLSLMVFLKIWLIYSILVDFSFLRVFTLVLWFLLMTTLYSAYMVVYNPKELFYKIIYSFMYEFFFVFTYFHALFNIRNQGKWITR